MKLRLRKDDAVGLGKGDSRADAVSLWLGSVARLLRLDEASRRGICEELEGHIRDRVRDLTLEGIEEREAIRRALDELGSAAELARRFQRGRGQYRRTLMYATLFVMAGSALALSIGSLTSGARGRSGYDMTAVHHSVFMPGQPATSSGAKAAPAALPGGGAVLAGKVNIASKEMGLRQVLEALSEQVSKSRFIHWDQLAEAGHEANAPLGLTMSDVTLETALRFINLTAKAEGARAIEVRVNDGVLEIGPRSWFDKHESVLVCYDIHNAVERGASAEEIEKAITELVEPEAWRQNGGDSAHLRRVGDRLFVSAPKRFHERVAWIIGRLEGGEAAGAPAAGGRTQTSASEGQLVFINGEVERPGVYNLPADGRLTLSRALLAAGGTGGGNREAVVFRRQRGKDVSVERRKVSELMEGGVEDPTLEAGDRVLVR